MVEKIYKFKCQDCGVVGEYPDKNKGKDLGWAVAQDGKTCYCPACAIYHRNTGRGGAKKKKSNK